MTRAKRLQALAESYDGVPASWDECSIFPAQWIADERGIEVPWPAYDSEEEGRALIHEAGGLVHVWEDVAKAIGFPERRDEPVRLGDVGVIRTSRHDQIGGIFADHGVFICRSINGTRYLAPKAYEWVRSEAGIGIRPVVLKVWQV